MEERKLTTGCTNARENLFPFLSFVFFKFFLLQMYNGTLILSHFCFVFFGAFGALVVGPVGTLGLESV